MEIQNNAFGSQVRFEDPDVVHYESGVEQHKMTQDDDETITEGQFSQSAKKGSKMLASGTFVRSWWSELFFCIGGLVTFMVIIVVLWLYDQKPQPQWALGITLNALLALLSTISKASFMISIAEVISQWKWNMHDSPDGRSLYDFTLIDLASRGFWGSCLLLGRFKWRHPISIAAFISIVSVMTSPLTQQAIDYPTRAVGTYGAASVGATRHWTPLEISDERMQVQEFMTQALHAGINNAPNPLDAVCPTAKCTLEPYESLAMCAKVADISNHLTVSNVMPEDDIEGRPRGMNNNTFHHTGVNGEPTPTHYLTLSNNITFDQDFPFALMSVPGNNTLAFRDDEAYNTSLVHLYIMHTRSDDQRGPNDSFDPPESFPDPPQFGAFEVMLHFCVNEYETIVEEGRSRTSVRRTRAKLIQSENRSWRERRGTRSSSSSSDLLPRFVQGNATDDTIDRVPTIECFVGNWDGAIPFRCLGKNITGSVTLAGVGSERPEDGFVIDVSLKLQEMAAMIAYSSYGLYGRMRGSYGTMSTVYKSQWSRKLRDAMFGKDRNLTDPEEQGKRLELFWGSVANSLSNAMRTSNKTDVFQGTAWDNEVYVDIRWGWLSFLASELLLATVFIAFTAFITHRTAVPVLKSSALAAFLAPDREAQRLMGSIDDLDSAKEKSKMACVRFDHKNLVLVPDGFDAANVGDSISRSSSVYTIY